MIWLVLMFVCALVGGAPVSLTNPWHVASVVCAGLFALGVIRRGRR